MLHGIGGRTIAEAKSSMSHAEAQVWFAYIKKYGPLNAARNLAEKLEYGHALICTVVNRTQGGKARVEDFMPTLRARMQEEAQDASPEAFHRLLTSIARQTPK